MQPFQIPPTVADPTDPASTRDAFARIAASVAAQREKAEHILGQVPPVRADLTRRMNTLPPADNRRAGLEEVRQIIDSAEAHLTTGLQRYQALDRQLAFMVSGAVPAGTSWTPRDAMRQAIAAGAAADRGVNGLRLAMTRFKAVMTGVEP